MIVSGTVYALEMDKTELRLLHNDGGMRREAVFSFAEFATLYSSIGDLQKDYAGGGLRGVSDRVMDRRIVIDYDHGLRRAGWAKSPASATS